MKPPLLHPIFFSFLLISALCGVPACSSTDDSDSDGNSEGCRDGERLVDGECVGGTRDAGVRDVRGGDDRARTNDDGSCTPGDQICDGPTTIARCEPDGTYLYIECGDSQSCQAGSCVDTIGCVPGDWEGCDSPTTYRLCADDGESYDVFDCPGETPNCIPGIEECTAMVCSPSQTRCAPGEQGIIEICNEDGSEWEFFDECDPGLSCDAGQCLSPCEENAKVPSFLGCDYWALDLDNIAEECDITGACRVGLTCNRATNTCEPSAASQQFSISVSNPNPDEVLVTILNNATSNESEVTVPGSTVQQIPLDRLDVDGIGLTSNAYHVTTSLPVTVHQFNPSNNVGVFSNDASLLLPANAGGDNYYVLSWPTGPFGALGGTALAYATVVAVGTDGPTTVTVTPSVPIPAGSGTPAMAASTATDVTMNYGQVLNLQTEGTVNRDLSGTWIQSSQPILVFAGHECAFVLDEEPTPFCDHIEQQLFPVAAWGDRYFAAKLSPRGGEVDAYRVVAAGGGTTITTTPAIPGANGQTLGRGQVIEFTTDQNFVLESNNPVMLGQYMVGSNFAGIEPSCFPISPADEAWCDTAGGLFGCPAGYTCDRDPGFCAIRCANTSECQALAPGSSIICGPEGYCSGSTGAGDPAFMLAVPESQFRDNYIFLTPADYRDDWFTAIVPDGTVLTLDGNALPTDGYQPIGASGWSVYHHDTSATGDSDPAQAHTLTGTAAFGLQVYGYDCDVSYAYPGGLNLTPDE